MARKATMISVGQGRATNTVKLRNQYTRWVIDQQSEGLNTMPFEKWVAEFHPDKKILSSGEK